MAGHDAGWNLHYAGVSIVLIAASVLAFQPGGLFRFVWVKLLVLVAALVFAVLSPAAGRMPKGLKMAIAVGSGWFAVAMLLSATPLASIVGRWPRHEGILVLGLYIALFAAGTRLLGGDTSGGSWHRLRLALSGVAMVLLIVGGLEAAGLRPLGGAEDVRPGATLGNATDQGLIGLVIAGVLSAIPKGSGSLQQWTLRAGFFSALATVLLSGSRAALMGAAIVVAAASVSWLKDRRDRVPVSLPVTVLMVLPLAVFTGAALLVPATRTRLFSSGTVDGRWMLWDRTGALLRHRPWSGVGPSGFVDALPGYLDSQWAQRVGGSFPADSPHNLLLQLLAGGGIPLVLIAAVFAGLFYKGALARIRECPAPSQRRQLVMALTATTAYALALLTHFTSPGTTGLVAFICGGLVGVALDRNANQGTPPPVARAAATSRPLGLLLAGAALAVIVPATAAEWSMADGARAARLGDTPGAEASFHTALGLRPWDSDVKLLAAQAFAGPATGGDMAAAKAAVRWGDLALARTPQSLEAGIAAAIGYIYSGDLPAAKNRLDAMAERAPYSAAVYTQRGVANFGLGRTDQSIADLRMAASLEPSLDTPWLLLAGIYERLGDQQNARSALLRAREAAAG